jgi:queuosine precursor transporter
MHSTLLVALYIACEIIANITANKPIQLLGMTAPGGVFIYALTFTLIDLINEQFGKQGARRVVFAAFAANILFALYSSFILALPSPAYYTNQEAFASVLGSTPRIVAASLLAYMVSSLIDVEVFDAWKRKVGGYRWLRVLASNTVSTGVDSALFVAVAFGGSLPLVPLILGQYVIKMGITVISVPLIYATLLWKTEAAGE